MEQRIGIHRADKRNGLKLSVCRGLRLCFTIEESSAKQLGAIGLSNFEREEEKKEIVLDSDVTN